MAGGMSPLLTMRPAAGGGFACSDLAACSLANLGTRDHHLTTGRDHDDHSLYALADKSRPSPWVAAADLSARSLADLGTRDHHLLAGLGDDDHPIYLLRSGRSGGQTAYGGTGSTQHLTLHSTVHPTPGYIRLQDDLQLLSNKVRDSGGNERITLATSSPHVALAGDLRVPAHAAIGSGAVVLAGYALRVVETLTLHPSAAAHFEAHGQRPGGPQFTYGIAGIASGEQASGLMFTYGLYFSALHAGAAPCNALGAIAVQQQSSVAGSGALAIARGFYLMVGYWGGSKPTTSIGLDIENQGHASVTTAYGVLVDDQTGVAVRLLELGPATPYFRVVGGGAPAANESNLYVRMGATLKLVTEGAADSGGAGFRQVLVPN